MRALNMASITSTITSTNCQTRGVHTLCHCFTTHLLESGTNIRDIQELLGHNHVETTVVYTHVVRQLAPPVQSPLDA